MLYKLHSSVSNNRVCLEQSTHRKTKSRFSWGRQLANSICSATIQAGAIRGAAATPWASRAPQLLVFQPLSD